ncbi:MAG: enoyl-CoA hydratase/isomerase family protein [Aeromicrobium sp.]
MDEISIEERDGVRLVTLQRPDRLNALTPDMVVRLTAAMTTDSRHRAVVVTGSGRGFCAGVDIAGAQERQVGRSNADAMVLQERFAAMAMAIHRCPVPVVAAVNGPAAGAGLAIALASDIRVAAPTARFLIGAPNIGLSAGECGISYFLPRLVGLGRAAEIMLTNRALDVDEAHRIGLVTSVTDDAVADAMAVAARIGELSPFGVAMTKQVYRQTAESPSLEIALALENRTQILANSTHDAAEARTAFLEKRRPVYTGA